MNLNAADFQVEEVTGWTSDAKLVSFLIVIFGRCIIENSQKDKN